MRLRQSSSALLYLLAILAPGRSIATPLIADESMPQLEDSQLFERACANPCGYYGQVCCAAGQVCFTNAANQAQCGSGSGTQTTQAANANANNGQWQMFTTTFVETESVTVVSTYSSFISAAATAGLVQTVTVAAATPSATAGCTYSLGQTPCGSICCAAGQYCDTSTNSCAAVGGGSSAYYSSFFTVTQSAVVPLRPTSGTVVTVTSTSTSTGKASSTVPFVTPVGTDGSTIVAPQASSSGGGLSGGAIAGIVIGVIAGIILLILLCICFCAKGLLDGLRSIFGLGNRRRRTTEETYIEERHSRRGRTGGRTWFGAGPSRVDRVEKKKTGGGFGGVAGVTAGLAALAVVLGLKRRHDRKRDEKSSFGTGSSYYSSEYSTSASECTEPCLRIINANISPGSESSDDRRTRDSRRSRSRR